MPTAQRARDRRSGSGYAAASWPALGTYAHLVIADRKQLKTARAKAERVLDAVDRACSRFRPDSDLIRANRSAGWWVKVSPLLVGALEAAMDAAALTNGLVDPTLGASLTAVGYDRDLRLIQGSDLPAVSPLPAIPGAWQAIELDPEGGVRVPAGVELDLGATGKAFAADLVAKRVAAATGSGVIVSLGGDVAIGQGADGVTHPWLVAVAERPDEVSSGDGEMVILEAGGLATSSTAHRRWKRGGRTVHHLIDPRTGRPVDPVWRTASVAAASCVAANTASTAAIVLGRGAEQWLRQHDLASRLVSAEGQVMRIAGWPEVEG